MNSELDNQLEIETDRLLKDLPDLAAPSDFVLRTMNRIGHPASPWHSRPWFAWPAGLRVAYLVFEIAALAGAILGWRAVQPGLFGAFTTKFSRWTASAECLWNALNVLVGAVGLVVDHLGKGLVFSCLLAVVLAYAICIGFGTAFVRLVRAGPRKNQL